MKQLLNTLYVMTQGAYLTLDHETLKVEVEGEKQLQAPLHHLGSIVIMGDVMMSLFSFAALVEGFDETAHRFFSFAHVQILLESL